MQEELASREGRKKERKEADRNCEHPRVHFWFLGLDSAFLVSCLLVSIQVFALVAWKRTLLPPRRGNECKIIDRLCFSYERRQRDEWWWI